MSYSKARLAAGLRLPMGPEGLIRTSISVVDSDALYRLSYLEAVREMKRVHAHQRKTLFQPRPHARGEVDAFSRQSLEPHIASHSQTSKGRIACKSGRSIILAFNSTLTKQKLLASAKSATKHDNQVR